MEFPKYLVFRNNEEGGKLHSHLFDFPNRVKAMEDAELYHVKHKIPSGVYALIETVGDQRYHFKLLNSDNLVLHDSATQKNFDGYQTAIGAKYVGEHMAKDIGLSEFKLEVY